MLSGADSHEGAYSREGSPHCSSAEPLHPTPLQLDSPRQCRGCGSSLQRKSLGGLQSSGPFLPRAPGKHNKHRPSSPCPCPSPWPSPCLSPSPAPAPAHGPPPALAPAQLYPTYSTALVQAQPCLWRAHLGLEHHFTANLEEWASLAQYGPLLFPS